MKFLTLASLFCFSAIANAQTFEVTEAKITSAIQDREAVDEKIAFATGEKAWIWLKLNPKGEAMMRLRYTVDNDPIWTMDPTPVRFGRTWYNKTLYYPGAWKVEILDGSDAVVHTLNFTVSGEPVPIDDAQGTELAAETPPPAVEANTETKPEASATPESQVGPSDRAEVIELKLAEEIQERMPVAPKTTFVSGSKVFTWVKLNVKEADSHIKMRWLINEQPVWTSDPIAVRQSPSWRTWFQKTLDVPGNWKVEILDADDKVLHAELFNVN